MPKDIMCTTEEVQAIVDKSEKHLLEKMRSLETRQDDRMEKSHMAISKSISGFGDDLKELQILTKENYSKREIDLSNENMKTQLDRIEKMIINDSKVAENNKTNFTKLDTKINSALWVLGLTIPVIISISTWIFFNELKNIKQSIEDTLPERVLPILEDYEFHVTGGNFND